MITVNIPKHELDLDYISVNESSRFTIMDVRKHLRYMWERSGTLRQYQFPLSNTGTFIWKITKELKRSITDHKGNI